MPLWGQRRSLRTTGRCDCWDLERKLRS